MGMCLRRHIGVGVRGCMCRCIFTSGQLWEYECVRMSVHISMWVSVFLHACSYMHAYMSLCPHVSLGLHMCAWERQNRCFVEHPSSGVTWHGVQY